MNIETKEALDRLIPEHCRAGMELWIKRGIRPGGFMTAVLCNDLAEAFARADDVNYSQIGKYVEFLYNYAPSDCWGSPERVNEWERNGGLAGFNGDLDQR